MVALILFAVSLIKHHDDPNWVWLCVFLGVAVIVEAKIVHKLLREREGGDEGKISAKAHGEAMAEVLKQLGLPKEPKA